MEKHFSLTGKNSIYRFPADKTVLIGEPGGCDVKLPNYTDYEDRIIAKIARNRDGEGWHLVRMEREANLKVNGTKVNRVAYLHDGDRIEVGTENFRFREEKGEKSEPTVYNIKTSKGTLWMAGGLVVVLALLFGGYIYMDKSTSLTEAQRGEIETSLFTTRVDSLQLMHGDSIIDSYVYAAGPVGTAFLTTDSMIVTARHCIQPWLNAVLPEDFSSIPASSEWPVATALKVETANQLSGNEDWRIISYITLTDEEGNSFPLSSEDFKINREFDDIVETGSYDNPMYWRSISHRYTRSDMMLGDIAAAPFVKGSKIEAADIGDLRRLLDKKGVKLAFFGHPESAVTGNKLEYKTDELRLPLSELPELPGRLFLLSHEGGLSPGFSGGPVIVRDGMGFKAVGVISVTDDRNGYRSYSVPTSELKPLKK